LGSLEILLTASSFQIRPVTAWTTTTSTVTVLGKDCTVTSHVITSEYDITTVEATTTNYVTIDSTVYATATVLETVSQLCAPTPHPDPVPVRPGEGGGQEPMPGPVVSSVTILEYEADYVSDQTSVALTSSTTLPLPITRTATVDENSTPSRVTSPLCADDGKLTYSFLQGYGWDNVEFNQTPDPNTELIFGPVTFNAMHWKYLDDKPNIVEQGNHPVLEATSGEASFRPTESGGKPKLQQFTIELPENADLDDVPLEFSLHVSSSSGQPLTRTYSLEGGSYGQRKSPSWDFTNQGLELESFTEHRWPGLMSLRRTDTGALVPFHLRQVLLCEG
ncbi:hypothetical protein QWA68_016608, partial [Fusarium oxysporum]